MPRAVLVKGSLVKPVVLFLVLLFACNPDRTGESDTDSSGGPAGDSVVYLCCGGGKATCAQGPCTPWGYCPVPCSLEEVDACGHGSTCIEADGYVTPICQSDGVTICYDRPET